jgi:hypothetical protein
MVPTYGTRAQKSQREENMKKPPAGPLPTPTKMVAADYVARLAVLSNRG